jgi:AraC-like DNA-binding protein
MAAHIAEQYIVVNMTNSPEGLIVIILYLMDYFIIFDLMKSIKKKEGFDGQRAIMLPRKIASLQCSSNPVIADAYITDMGYYPKARFHHRKRIHGIDQNILIYCVEGKGKAQINHDNYQILPGDFFVVPASMPHHYEADEEHAWTIYWLHLKGKMSDSICNSIAKKYNGFKGSVNYSEKRIQLFDEIYSNLERGYSNDNITYANMCLWNFMASFMFDNKFNYSTKELTPDVTSVAIDYMQQHLTDTLTLTEISARVNLSVSHFAAIFHKKTGFAPIEYFNHLKIQKACQYLQFTDDRVNEISNHLGIEDPYYFSRLFKKLMGVSPNEYRKVKRERANV